MSAEERTPKGYHSPFAAHFARLQEQSTRLILVRHGEATMPAEYVRGPLNTPLSTRGIEQAKRVAERLRDFDCSAVYTSPLKRASETAEIISQTLQLPVAKTEALREIDLTLHAPAEMPLAEVYSQIEDLWNANPSSGYWLKWADLPFAETGEELRQRVTSAIDEILPQNIGETVCIVCHGGVINGYLGSLLSLSHDFWFHPHNTSLNIVSVYQGSFLLHTLNDVGHLQFNETSKEGLLT